ncbi:hypothetical protein C2G38_2058255, partial [Gigaspora rosea]
VGNVGAIITRGGRIFDDTCRSADISFFVISSQRAFSKICWYGCTLLLMSSLDI